MILTELELHNFGVYKGLHSIRLDPPVGRPVVLFGGLNGAGKTTLLEAILLALYGKRTPTGKREGLAYEDYLRRCVHHAVPAGEGASVRLRFTLRMGGELRTIRISRVWHDSGSRIREIREVHQGLPGRERLDTQLTARWDEHVDRVVPLGVAPLFFFDADRIESFADLANSGELIRSAVHGLLGLDLIDRLATDLEILERRKLVQVTKNGRDDSLSVAEEMLQGAESELSAAQERLDQLEQRAHEATIRAEAIDKRYRREGGDLFAQRQALEAHLRETREAASLLADGMRTSAAGIAPLLLVRPLLEKLRNEDQADQTREASVLLMSLLDARDTSLVRFVKDVAPTQPEVANAVARFLAADRSQRRHVAGSPPVFELSRRSREQLAALLDQELDNAHGEITSQLDRWGELSERIEDVERTIRGIPEEDAIKPLLRDRTVVHSIRAEIDRSLAKALEERDYFFRQREVARNRWIAAREKAIARQWRDRTAKRVVMFSSRSRDRLAMFRKRVLARNITRIERLVLESFQQLLRKSEMVRGLAIDAQSLSVRLHGYDGHLLHPDRLSAGERQLLAVSLLWGLARASRRVIPTIIDTPMGRLDSVHREHLVTRYFPYASHQVILLSTDEEIVGSYLDRLSPHVGRSYHLVYEERSAKTRIETGYFNAEVAA